MDRNGAQCAYLLLFSGLSAQKSKGSESQRALLAEARKAVTAEPDYLAPQMLAYVAANEGRVERAQAGQDFRAAFNSAESVPIPEAYLEAIARNDQAAEVGFMADPKYVAMMAKDAESAAVHGLLELGDTAGAVALARRSDVPPKSTYYNFVIPAVIRAQGPEAGLALVRECQGADGSFAYGGAQMILRDRRLGEADRGALIAQAYRALEADAARGDFSGANFALASYQIAPQYAPQLEDVLARLLERRSAQTDPNLTGTARRLLVLLQKIDTDRGRELAQKYPALAGPVPGRVPLHSSTTMTGAYHHALDMPPERALVQLAATDPAAALAQANALGDSQDRFRSLCALAESLVKSQPRASAAAADAALGLADALRFRRMRRRPQPLPQCSANSVEAATRTR